MNIAKKVLTRQGIQYFDDGGNVISPPVLPPQNTVSGAPAGFGSTTSSVINPTQSIPGQLNPIQSATDAVNFAGGTTQAIGSAFTPQSGYVAGLAPTQLTNYQPLIGAATNNAVAGEGGFGQSASEQQQLINALQASAQNIGQGPNIAQAALNQNTQANVANQAALQASQRGASANAGLIARQAAQTGAATQENAVTSAATLAAQQTLAQQNAQIAAEQAAVAGQAGLTSDVTAEQNANTNLLNTATGAQNTQNTGQIQNVNNAQTINSGTAAANAAATQKTTGGLLNGAGSLLSLLAKGGAVPEHYQKMISLYHPHVMTAGGKVPGEPKVNHNAYKNDTVPALLTPKEIVLPLSVTQAKNAPEAARDFVARELGKQAGDSDKEDESDFKAALKQAISNRKSKGGYACAA